MVAYLLAMIDRIILALLFGPLERDLGLSHTQFGVLTGAAFAIFYAVAGVPLGWLVDRSPRKTVIASGVGLWSLMTMLSAAASSFAGLFVARVGVGVGEAALNPGAYSMISDLFRGDRLGRALAVFSSGQMIGAGLAFALGGALVSWLDGVHEISLPLIGSLRPWQLIFLIAGAPGIFLALVVLRLPEPQRTATRHVVEGAEGRLSSFLKIHWRALLLFVLGPCLLTLIYSAFLTWMPTMLIRKFDMDPAFVGLAMGLGMGAFGLFGLLVGGVLGDKWVRQGWSNGHIRVCGWAMIAALPFAFGVLGTSHPAISIASLMGLFFFLAIPSPCIVATLQLISPSLLRGRLSAIYLMTCNIIGMGLGPLVVGALNDHGTPLFSLKEVLIDQSLLLVAMVCIPLTGLSFFIARRPVLTLITRISPAYSP